MEEQPARSAQDSKEADGPVTVTFPYNEIAALAYSFWQSRGCPDGGREEDWFRAEQELKAKKGIRP
jgi:DUF2934 family protein